MYIPHPSHQSTGSVGLAVRNPHFTYGTMITHDPLPINPQADREAAIDAFKKGEKDVLVATDVASKGLDFADIQHVVNYDM